MAQGPLSGIRVVELCSWFTGPMAACILADQGADVIKVEPPGGDAFRISGTSRAGYGAMFMSANRNKRSIVLDLKDPEQKANALELIASADIVIQNARPGAMARLGLDAETLRARDSRLIYVSISGYGQTGPLAEAPAFDPLAQGISGLCVVQGGSERPQIVRTMVVDKLIGPIVAQAICSALFQRERTGEGTTIDCSMLDTMVWWMWPDAMMNETFLGEGVSRAAAVAEADSICPTKDGFLVASPHQEKDWQAFIDITGRHDLRTDPRFLTARDRQADLKSYYVEVRASFGAKTTDEWIALMREKGIPCAPVLSQAQFISYPQVVWNDSVETVEHPVAGRHLSPRAPARFDGHAAGIVRPAPAIGEHSAEVLAELAARNGEIRRAVD